MHESHARFSRDRESDLKNSFRQISGSICAPRGFKCAAVFCDIKRLGTGKGSEKGQKRDLALIVSEGRAAVAGMFTTNQVRAAPVHVSAKRARGIARAIVVNSGNANACTGQQGFADAERMTGLAARLLHTLKARVLVCSTGRIGVPLPMKNIERGIRDCVPLLKSSTLSARQVAEAIMTTDTRRKEAAVEFELDDRRVRIGGVCKGAGMIQPGMGSCAPTLLSKHATMLCLLTTDAEISPLALRQCLSISVAQSFNRITVDGDMSTNDSVIILANGYAENRPLVWVGPRDPRKARVLDRRKPNQLELLLKFQDALNFVCLELAKMIVRDGEGTSRVVRLHVRGAASDREAEAAARSVANSSLVRTSWCGGDPNWGRILCALGYSKASIDESKIDVGYAPTGSRKILFAFRRGRPTNVALKALAKITSQPEFDLYVDLHRGRGAFVLYAADLTEEYVAFNKGDVTDPTTLGG
jgi:glutamate N-acetyltransferase/amino-acid N-acetyltransferase